MWFLICVISTIFKFPGYLILKWKEIHEIYENTSEFRMLYSVQFSCSVMSSSLRPFGLQHSRPPCPSPTPGAYTQTHVHWVSDVIQPSHLVSPPSPPAFNLSQHEDFFKWVSFYASGGQNIGVSASSSVLPMQDWFPLGWPGWISLLSKGFSKVFSKP